MIFDNPKWNPEAKQVIQHSVEQLLWDKWRVRLESAKIAAANSPELRPHILRNRAAFVATQYRNVDRKGVAAWLWRFLGKVFRKPGWILRGQDEIVLPPISLETEIIQLERYFVELPDGVIHWWWMGYGPRTNYLAWGAWEGATGTRKYESIEA